MYESFFGMEHTPFVRDVPPEKLFESKPPIGYCTTSGQIDQKSYNYILNLYFPFP